MPDVIRTPRTLALQRLGQPIWLDRSDDEEAAQFPVLRRDIDVEVAVVGGGATGAAIAWRFAEEGVGVVVLEAARIGRGATAASSALLMQEPDIDLGELSGRYGARRAHRIWELCRDGARDYIAAIRRLGIRCDLVELDSVYYTLKEDAASRLRAEHRRRRRSGFRARWLSAHELMSATGIRGAAGLRTRGNAQVDPYRCCLGLMHAAAARGAQIFERSAVRAIRTSPSDVMLQTAHAKVRASRVIVATGTATRHFAPLAGRFRMMQTYVLGTRPLTAAERRRVGLGRTMIWETGWPYHYARWSPDHRLLVGGADRPQQHGAARARAFRKATSDLVDYFLELYPALAGITFEYGWEGLLAMTPDGLPYIGPHRRYPKHLFALGYGGNGMTFGFLASQLLLDAHRGKPSRDLKLFAFNRMSRRATASKK